MLLIICISLEKCLFKPFALLKTGLFVFLLLCCKSSFYSPDTRPLSDTWFVNISPLLLADYYCHPPSDLLTPSLGSPQDTSWCPYCLLSNWHRAVPPTHLLVNQRFLSWAGASNGAPDKHEQVWADSHPAGQLSAQLSPTGRGGHSLCRAQRTAAPGPSKSPTPREGGHMDRGVYQSF